MNFEQSFQRLEEILQKVSRPDTPLEESMKLFEEANVLIKNCQGSLSKAEKKVEMLVKNREAEVTKEAGGKPQLMPFTP